MGREGAISGGSQAAAGGADRFTQAYLALRHDPSIQFSLSPAPKPAKLPPWLKAIFDTVGRGLELIGRFLKWIASILPDAQYARILLWVVIAAGAALLAWLLFNRIRHGEWRLRTIGLAPSGVDEVEEEWAPAEAGARSWLEEADALASQARFAEAIHHLLFRSIEDIARRRPTLVRPALTSRELAAASGIPARARQLFADIARQVERSLFGGLEVVESDWLDARRSYSDFALPGAWRT